jgi:pantoate--beta-alanine ligase
MKSVIQLDELKEALRELIRPVGFVPTMGYLHRGHLSLVKQANKDCRSVVVSIFANPTQFAPEEDLENYPRDIDRDLDLLDEEGADLVWLPTTDIMYPEDFQTWVEVEQLTKVLEGKYRQTHFRGVTTVVSKLFNAVQPDKTYFGQKDAQQAVVVKQMIRDLNYLIEIVICPIIREEDGLAMSSRNIYLSESERLAARCLSRGLFAAGDAFQEGEHRAETLKEIVTHEVDREELADLQYVSCANPDTLQELSGEVDFCLISMAVYIGGTRLIDNIILSTSN